MNIRIPATKKTLVDEKLPPLIFLKTPQIAMIDEALVSLGEYGELHLVVEKGCLRFLVTNKSFDALKWTPGAILDESRKPG
jgi:hypothetical protein